MGFVPGPMRCRPKHFVALVISVMVTSFILSVFNQKQPHAFQDIVTQTHKQFENLKENIQAGVEIAWGDKHLDVEEKYLSMLGFVRDPMETTQAQKLGLDMAGSDLASVNGSVPVWIITAINKAQWNQFEDFLINVHTTSPSSPIAVWNIESDTPIEEDDEFSLSLKQLCNSTLCYVKRFNFEEYPEHVRDLSFKAFRPLIMQVMLDAGNWCALWLDIDRRFIAQAKMNLIKYSELAKTGGSNGILGWPSGHPTSSLTHPKMFPYFETTAENFYFHRMIDPSQLLMCKTDHLISKVMKPWVACSLKKECIAPFGAQSGGCRFDKKPLYRYSGCHGYDAAALNVALGVAFPMHQPYISRTPLTKPIQLILKNSTTTL